MMRLENELENKFAEDENVCVGRAVGREAADR